VLQYMIVLCSVLVLLHAYVWRRLVRDTRLPRPMRYAAALMLLLLAAAVPARFLLRGALPHAGALVIKGITYGWLGFVAYLAGWLLLRDALRVIGWCFAWLRRSRTTVVPSVPEPAAAQHETRRVFVARVAAGSALVAAGGIGAFGVRSALWDITLPEVPVGLPRLPRALDGFTIALLTDVHIGPMLDGRFLRHLVELTNRARPDIVAIGGDLVDGSVARIGSQVAELRHLRARHGVCFVTGNHEYYSGSDEWVAFLRTLGVRVLMNERIALGDATVRGAQFDLGGIPDHRAAHNSAVGPDAHAVTLGRDPERELVMLAHQPVQIAQTAQVGTGLQLSGHTHGGQLYPFGAVALLAQPYLAGLHRHPETDTQVYVSRGTGFWGPPMRVLAPAEIALVRLHSV
jgi:predicted MPP superfamily phosphohydrolase